MITDVPAVCHATFPGRFVEPQGRYISLHIQVAMMLHPVPGVDVIKLHSG
jgi:hypothetical protein